MRLIRNAARRLRDRIAQTVPPNDSRYFRDMPAYTIDGVIYDTDCLILSFEDAFKGIDRSNIHRPGWGAKLFERQRMSHLCFKPKSIDWYRHPGFPALLADLRAEPVFSQFERTVAYGGSMGGFAALTFADHLGVTDVLALNPQTTLDRDLVPWETRFANARRQNWKGPFADAVGGSDQARQVVVVFDPFVAGDAAQVARLQQSNLTCLRAPFLGHGIAKSLTELQALVPLLESIVAGAADQRQFYEHIRRRKSLPRHLDILSAHPRVAASALFCDIVTRAKARNAGES